MSGSIRPVYTSFCFGFLIFLGSNVPDWRLVNSHVSKEGKLKKEDFVTIITETTELLSKAIA